MRLLNPAVEIGSLNLLQGGFESHSRHHAHLTQLAEVVVSKAICSGFESQSEHHAPVVQPVETTVLEAVRCEFESHLGHHLRESVNGKPIGSKPMTESSNLSSRAMVLSSSGLRHFVVSEDIEGSNPFRTAIKLATRKRAEHPNEIAEI